MTWLGRSFIAVIVHTTTDNVFEGAEFIVIKFRRKLYK